MSLIGIVRYTTGFGPDLPGEELGLIESSDTEACTVEPEQDETPDAPQPAAGAWREEPALPEPRNEVRTSTVDGRILAVGAQEVSSDASTISSASFRSFDPMSGRYENLPDAPIPVDHAVVVTYDHDLYMVGGASNGVATNSVWRYSPATRKWRDLAPMQVARYAPAGDVIGHRLYVTGGAEEEGSSSFNSMEVYDFETGEWTAGPDMPTGRHHHSAAAVDGKLYVAGGRQPEDESLDTFERFDPVIGEWEELSQLPQGSGGSAAVATDREVIVIGGGDDAESWVTGAVWAFDPRMDQWRRLPNLRVPRHGHAAAIANGRVYVLGGAPCPLFGLTDHVESLRIR